MSPALVLTGSNVEQLRRCTVAVEGVVQGVGFRPFVYRLAQRCRLAGYVRNDSRGVRIELQGQQSGIQRFLDALVAEAPIAARAMRLTVAWSEVLVDASGFRIDVSLGDGPSSLFPAPELGTCAACLRELEDPDDRRYRYPFLNCTGCGPRFTIIDALPYDRERTWMARAGPSGRGSTSRTRRLSEPASSSSTKMGRSGRCSCPSCRPS